LTRKQLAELKSLAALPVGAIDTSDAPEVECKIVHWRAMADDEDGTIASPR